MTKAKDERFVPKTKMGERYLKVHARAEKPKVWKRGERTAYQRSLAEQDLADVGSLVRDFTSSVEQFERYRPREEPFHPKRKVDALKRWRGPGKPNTARLAARIAADGVDARGTLPSLTYEGRELVPSRTTSPSDFEKPLGTKLRLDLLFSAAGQPVVAEVKAIGDENAYYALIQGLALCAQLAPSAQRKRLSTFYPNLMETGPIQLWVILASHNSRGPDKAEMVTLARDIAGELLRHAPVDQYLSAIICADAEIPPQGPVQLSERWQSRPTS